MIKMTAHDVVFLREYGERRELALRMMDFWMAGLAMRVDGIVWLPPLCHDEERY